ncbi:hypothetical protein EIN_020270 [Entamoeba invadens IP1]|uniref:hypothetical protein n=1 Tax=Entamoeba invadens IP1 TaxID=370355 RepID=UPI0002C3DD03|nr:hypothetical protein EIN_020270 [Entamoeba invadens IP1]ELP90578.1 hypothetical protein EIN_020270 [Entamoeba invadens IP1]|eukprot:XP_004257349.1 hypothetical protein EIN_020270 [Entamoeba invadens IP1]
MTSNQELNLCDKLQSLERAINEDKVTNITNTLEIPSYSFPIINTNNISAITHSITLNTPPKFPVVSMVPPKTQKVQQLISDKFFNKVIGTLPKQSDATSLNNALAEVKRYEGVVEEQKKKIESLEITICYLNDETEDVRAIFLKQGELETANKVLKERNDFLFQRCEILSEEVDALEIIKEQNKIIESKYNTLKSDYDNLMRQKEQVVEDERRATLDNILEREKSFQSQQQLAQFHSEMDKEIARRVSFILEDKTKVYKRHEAEMKSEIELLKLEWERSKMETKMMKEKYDNKVRDFNTLYKSLQKEICQTTDLELQVKEREKQINELSQTLETTKQFLLPISNTKDKNFSMLQERCYILEKLQAQVQEQKSELNLIIYRREKVIDQLYEYIRALIKEYDIYFDITLQIVIYFLQIAGIDINVTFNSDEIANQAFEKIKQSTDTINPRKDADIPQTTRINFCDELGPIIGTECAELIDRLFKDNVLEVTKFTLPNGDVNVKHNDGEISTQQGTTPSGQSTLEEKKINQNANELIRPIKTVQPIQRQPEVEVPVAKKMILRENAETTDPKTLEMMKKRKGGMIW